ncbi:MULTISPECIES: phosphatase PAP2 family protein [Enterococcus]|uniref:Phosphatidic acid phosphatase type 2/haloperoxidase domain-containing protein n=1 Tax=Enterococcus sulfureus ATCC 49903 TaxID=1140003 RepID=S0PBL0_9ENTE|nr:phosphatase PAP2 family protein [Enterococcus sulfureus]EOT48773.1 hypothetical protein OMY_00729 [Enterococcus sulfureus ATCC 49903]EOT87665.1 hypothetical protein I573_00722 [Enterococcus sulfureus ATCC 49903]
MKIKSLTNMQWIGCITLVLFLGLASIVKFQLGLLHPFDQTITDFVRSDYPNWNTFFVTITKFGDPISIGLISIIVFSFLYLKKFKRAAIWFASGVIGISTIGNSVLKLIFMRERPTLEHLVTEHTYSFPSGHSTGSMVVYGMILLLLPLVVKQKSLRFILQFALALLILGIGTSRIYSGVHYPSDVLGGYLFGLSWLLLSYPIYKGVHHE